ncbi:MAG: pilin [Patescibacteria group bacterium]|nr:pilin [Patescibacteria group bacterium]
MKTKQLGLKCFFLFTILLGCLLACSYCLAQGSSGSQSIDISDISPVSTNLTVPQVIGNTVKVLLGIVGSIAFIMFIYGGMYMLTSHGNPDMVKKGKDVLTWAIIGLIVIFGSYVFVSFIVSGITGGTGGVKPNTETPITQTQNTTTCQLYAASLGKGYKCAAFTCDEGYLEQNGSFTDCSGGTPICCIQNSTSD